MRTQPSVHRIGLSLAGVLLLGLGVCWDAPADQRLPAERTAESEVRFSGAAGAQGPAQVTICHKPGTSAEQTLMLPDAAVPLHLRHGDRLGACGQSPPPELVRLRETIGCGGSYTCGVSSGGGAYCWGYNDDGQLGNTTYISLPYPVPVDAWFGFTQISVGYDHTCGLTTYWTAFCWGNDIYGQLGNGIENATFPYPVEVAGGLAFEQISAGKLHTCALTTSGEAYCWGWNGDGQLGDGTKTTSSTPTAVQTNLVFAQISAGDFHTCAIAAGSGAAYCWGSNDYGQLGDGTKTARSTPTAVSGGLVFQQITGGSLHTCGVANAGTYCWGYNGEGELGDGTTSSRLIPRAVYGNHWFTSVSAGLDHTCGVTEAGAFCWGANYQGQLGDGTTTSRTTPTAVAGGLVFSQVSASSGQHSCGVTTTGAAYCWGDNRGGQLGLGTAIPYSVTPVAVSGGHVFIW